jgi:RNA polymerase sigma-70 factor, ECF subfamily
LETFEYLYKQNYKSLHRIAQKMLCHDRGNDIVQDVFIDFYEKTRNGKIVDYPKSYLYRSTLNKCIDEQRKNRKFSDNEIPETLYNGHQEYESREIKACIGHCLSEISSKEKELLILYSEGLSYKEMSEVTEIPFTSIGKTLSRSLKKLEKELKVKGYELY